MFIHLAENSFISIFKPFSYSHCCMSPLAEGNLNAELHDLLADTGVDLSISEARDDHESTADVTNYASSSNRDDVTMELHTATESAENSASELYSAQTLSVDDAVSSDMPSAGVNSAALPPASLPRRAQPVTAQPEFIVEHTEIGETSTSSQDHSTSFSHL